MKRKLEEMGTISSVHVEREQYPSSTSGGWGGVAVENNAEGGYVWKARLGYLDRKLSIVGWRLPI